jgi:DnaK suppressor protein
VSNVAQAKKKASAKKKRVTSRAAKKASRAKSAARPAKKPAKNAVPKSAVRKPAKKAAGKAHAKPAKVAKPAAKISAKAKPIAPKPAKAAAKPLAVKTASAAKPVSKPEAALATQPKKKSDKKTTAIAKIASDPRARRVARAATAVAKTPSHDHSTPPVRPRMINLEDVKLPAGYTPRADEEYMNPRQLVYFRTKLLSWRDELIAESQETLDHLRSEIRDVGDEAERASRESDNILELRTRDRYRKLLKKIDDAVKRIEDGSYGFCEETGEEIGLGRLEARPIATLTVDAQERRELFQRQFRDDR